MAKAIKAARFEPGMKINLTETKLIERLLECVNSSEEYHYLLSRLHELKGGYAHQ